MSLSWRDGLCDHLITGHLELLIEENKAMFFLGLNKTVWDAFIHWTDQEVTGILYKNGEGSVGCSVLVESWRSENEGKPFQAEVLYFEFPGEFDCERLEMDALLLRLLQASEEIDDGSEPKSYLEECRNEINSLANELREDCHKRVETVGESLERGDKPKRSVREELDYLKEIDAWQANVNEIAIARAELLASGETLHSLNDDDLSEEEFEMLPRIYPHISCTSFGFLCDSSLVKRRLWLRGKPDNYYR